VALEEAQWDAARPLPGAGGLACKFIAGLYQSGGLQALDGLSGNYVIFICDRRAGQCFLVTDRCGMLLAYHAASLEQSRVFGSHPDAVASVAGEDQRLDFTSLAEFLMAGRLTFPRTYYQNVSGLDAGCVYMFALAGAELVYQSRRRYFSFQFAPDSRETEDDLAQSLAGAFGRAVRRRTAPVLGRAWVGLSGGLDSRMILSATPYREQLQAFTLYDEVNAESRTARQLAAACKVELVPIRRDFEYYADSAEMGVRISGGMGCFASNHFLGIRDRLRQAGVQNLLTGCYCDYLLKALALNAAEQRFSRREQIVDFNFQFYRPVYDTATMHRERVRERWAALFPESRKKTLTAMDWLVIEQKRSFPLAYEADLAQRVIPQRVLPWFVPIVDKDVLDVYLRIPSQFKLNASLFKKTVLLMCDEAVRRVPDNNSGAPPGSSRARHAFHRYLTALRNRVGEKLFPRMATHGSWPNWGYYLRHSSRLESLWRRPNETARGILLQVLGQDPFPQPVADYRGRDLEFFLRLLTLKLWLDQRTLDRVAPVTPTS
jgi:asparagine synthase (glutamine-hydrolysing)